MSPKENRARVIANHLEIVARQIGDGSYQLTESEREMLVKLIQKVNFGQISTDTEKEEER